MELTIGKHRLSMDGPGYQVCRVATHRKTGEQYQADHLYYSTLEGAAKALVERMSGDGLREDRPEVVDLKSLIEAIVQAKADVVRAVEEWHPRVE